jgi:5'-nucleotidase
MRLLLCNDDGISAPGIVALHDALRAVRSADGAPWFTEVMVVAPLTVQSATSHGVTFRQPLITRQVRASASMSGIAVDGRPADCVKLALSVLWPERFGAGSRPDLVVSGMNMGANVGINVLYSGTVAAAIEAAFLGVPAIAVSLHLGAGQARYDIAAAHAAQVIARVLAKGPLRAHECLSINVPITEGQGPCPPVPPCPPVRVCPMNAHGMIDAFTTNTNPLGETYYWAAGEPLEFHKLEPGSDVQGLFQGAITVTPLIYDLTDHPGLNHWRDRLRGE